MALSRYEGGYELCVFISLSTFHATVYGSTIFLSNTTKILSNTNCLTIRNIKSAQERIVQMNSGIENKNDEKLT